jgi:hypothetical protein
VHLASSALMSLTSYRDKVILFEGTHISQSSHSILTVPVTVISAVRSHNVPRVSKSYESFGDRFTTTTVDDLATSDLSQAVKGV